MTSMVIHNTNRFMEYYFPLRLHMVRVEAWSKYHSLYSSHHKGFARTLGHIGDVIAHRTSTEVLTSDATLMNMPMDVVEQYKNSM